MCGFVGEVSGVTPVDPIPVVVPLGALPLSEVWLWQCGLPTCLPVVQSPAKSMLFIDKNSNSAKGATFLMASS